jgi:peptidyl-prolyl cis-trans isomerase B (cyclophilin B)
MARTPDYNSASSQFYIIHQEGSWLDGDYAAFGYVLAGMDVVDAIATCDVYGSSNAPMPVENIIIESATFVQPK